MGFACEIGEIAQGCGLIARPLRDGFHRFFARSNRENRFLSSAIRPISLETWIEEEFNAHELKIR